MTGRIGCSQGGPSPQPQRSDAASVLGLHVAAGEASAMNPETVLLSRVQFALTAGYHILWPAYAIGISGYIVLLNAMWLATGRTVYFLLGLVDPGDIGKGDLDVLLDINFGLRLSFMPCFLPAGGRGRLDADQRTGRMFCQVH
jgi:hypothetical protein